MADCLFEASYDLVEGASYSATGVTRATAFWRIGRHGNRTQVRGNRARPLWTTRYRTWRLRLQVPSTPQK